jgi:hypothetical protein
VPDRVLRLAAVAEPLTLLVLLANLATAHVEAVAAAVGPLHGTAYLAAILATWAGDHSRAARLLALVPGVGALLAVRRDRRPRRPTPASGPRSGGPTGRRPGS